MINQSALELRGRLAAGEISATEVVAAYLAQIELLNPELNALTTVTADEALSNASKLDVGTALGRIDKPLWGLPFADKDLTDRAGVPTTYGSAPFMLHVPETSSPITQVLDEAGGVSVGKTNVPEFGFPAYSQNALPTGYARNPWDPNLDPGGSSSGAASAVAARMLPLAPGSDAGGSVRTPASATGLVGLKPTRGRVLAESGVNALAGLPTGGPLARTTLDAALLLDAMVGGQPLFTLRAPDSPGLTDTGSFVEAALLPSAPLRIGYNTWSPWASDYSIEVDPQILEVFEETLGLLKALGHHVEPAAPTPFPPFVEAFRTVWMASAASLPVPEEAFGHLEPLTQWLIETGRQRSIGELPPALMALFAFETQISRDYAPFDLVVTPATGQTPRPFNWYSSDDGELNFVQQTQYTPFTAYANVAGLPAISMPVGQGTSEVTGSAVPIGVQAIGRAGDEVTLLRLSHQLEQNLKWAERIPPAALV